MNEKAVQISKSQELQSSINSILGITERAGYKFITSEMKSKNGSQSWELGKWYKCKGKLKTCHNGFHDTETPRQSLNFIYGDLWCITETRGASTERDKDGKCAHREMRIVRAIETKPILVKFAILCARRSLHYYEEKYPDDKRPRLAIEAAEEWLKHPNDKSVSAARSAAESAESAAESAESAWSAQSAAESARSAAESAARSAARSARLAAWLAAWSAAWSAAESAEKQWQNETLLGLILEEVSR